MKGRNILGQNSRLAGSVATHRLVWLRMRERMDMKKREKGLEVTRARP